MSPSKYCTGTGMGMAEDGVGWVLAGCFFHLLAPRVGLRLLWGGTRDTKERGREKAAQHK